MHGLNPSGSKSLLAPHRAGHTVCRVSAAAAWLHTNGVCQAGHPINSLPYFLPVMVFRLGEPHSSWLSHQHLNHMKHFLGDRLLVFCRRVMSSPLQSSWAGDTPTVIIRNCFWYNLEIGLSPPNTSKTQSEMTQLKQTIGRAAIPGWKLSQVASTCFWKNSSLLSVHTGGGGLKSYERSFLVCRI